MQLCEILPNPSCGVVPFCIFTRIYFECLFPHILVNRMPYEASEILLILQLQNGISAVLIGISLILIIFLISLSLCFFPINLCLGFFLLIFVSCLHTRNISPLSVICIANIFPVYNVPFDFVYGDFSHAKDFFMQLNYLLLILDFES